MCDHLSPGKWRRSRAAQLLDQLVQVGLELGAAARGDVVEVVLGEEAVAEQPLRSEGQHHVLLVGGELEPEHARVSHDVAGHDHAAAASASRHHHQAFVNIPEENIFS